MRIDIDSLSSVTGWTVNAPSTIAAVAEPGFIAGLNDTSLLLRFDKLDGVKTAVKTFTAIDVSQAETLTLSIWSQSKKESIYRTAADFAYKLKVNATQEFYLPIWETFTDVNIAIEDVTSIDRLEITALHGDTDYIVISECVAEKEELPLDILNALKTTLETFFTRAFTNGVLLGAVTTTAGDETLGLDFSYAEQYAVVFIDDGANSETHQLDDGAAGTYRLKDGFDGLAIQNSHAAANAYIKFPVMINPDQREIRLPGVAIWNMTPAAVLQSAKLDRKVEGWRADEDTFQEAPEGQHYQYDVLIDCEAWHMSLIDDMSREVRRLCAGEVLWVNGRKHDVFFTGPPTEIRPPTGVDIIPKVQYSMNIQAVERIENRRTLVKTLTTNISAIPQRGGTL